MLKVGVLTFHRCINYGSYWQARCLASGLRARGHQPLILDHASRRVDIAEWKCALRPTLPQATPKSDYPRYRTKIRRFLRAIEALPLSPPFALEAPDSGDSPRCDLVVVGSDEVWNLSHPWYGRCALFYGDRLHAPRLAAYAASFGHHHTERLEPCWAQRLSRFEPISVRDEASAAIVERATGAWPELVLDPCLQFPVEADAEAGTSAPDTPIPPYLAVYGHGFSPAFVERVRRWARQRRLPIVSIGYRNDWADRQWLEAGPHEFARFIAAAQAVATNFFHGCVFALRERKPFVCEPSWYRGTKLRGLMASIGGERHLQPQGAPAADLEARLEAPPAAAIQFRIERLRARSDRFLDRALAA